MQTFVFGSTAYPLKVRKNWLGVSAPCFSSLPFLVKEWIFSEDSRMLAKLQHQLASSALNERLDALQTITLSIMNEGDDIKPLAMRAAAKAMLIR